MFTLPSLFFSSPVHFNQHFHFYHLINIINIPNSFMLPFLLNANPLIALTEFSIITLLLLFSIAYFHPHLLFHCRFILYNIHHCFYPPYYIINLPDILLNRLWIIDLSSPQLLMTATFSFDSPPCFL